MNRLRLSSAAIASTLAVASGGLATNALAQAAGPIPAAPGALSVENNPIGDLLNDAGAEAVLEKDMPALLAYPGLDQIKGMTLRAISVFPETQLDDEKLTAIQNDLNAARK